jgi:hypothetical protein
MGNIKVVAVDKIRTNTLVIWACVISIALVAPLFPLQQVTGPIINALLFIAVVMLGLRQTLPVCFMPSIMALLAGLLLPIMVPIVPFIMLSNVVLVVTFSYLYQRNFWLGVVMASILKFIFIWSTTSAMANLFIKNSKVIQVVATMMSWPQLISALAGGVIAYLFLRFIRRI